MNTAPNSNVKLTLEQLQQINQVETILGNLQNEIDIVNRNISSAKNDLTRITSEKEYATSQLTEVSAKLKETTTLHEILLTAVEKSKIALSDHSLKSEEISNKMVENMGTMQYEKIALDREKLEHAKNIEKFTEEKNQFAKEKEHLNTVKDLFAKAISSL